MKPSNRPIALLKQREIDAYRANAERALREWSQSWLSADGLSVECLAVDGSVPDPQHGTWSAYRIDNAGLVWCFQSHAFEKRIESALFELDDTMRNMDRHRASDLAQGVVVTALNDLQAALAGSMLGRAQRSFEPDLPPDAWLFKRLSGTAQIRVTIGDAALSLFVPTEFSPQQRGTSRSNVPVTPLLNAVTGIDLRVVAELGEVEMSLGEFASLQLGDVIDLAIRIDQPLTLLSENRSPIGAAHLGQQNGYRALDVFRFPQK